MMHDTIGEFAWSWSWLEQLKQVGRVGARSGCGSIALIRQTQTERALKQSRCFFIRRRERNARLMSRPRLLSQAGLSRKHIVICLSTHQRTCSSHCSVLFGSKVAVSDQLVSRGERRIVAKIVTLSNSLLSLLCNPFLQRRKERCDHVKFVRTNSLIAIGLFRSFFPVVSRQG